MLNVEYPFSENGQKNAQRNANILMTAVEVIDDYISLFIVLGSNLLLVSSSTHNT
jgi:hypothetical protein